MVDSDRGRLMIIWQFQDHRSSNYVPANSSSHYYASYDPWWGASDHVQRYDDKPSTVAYAFGRCITTGGYRIHGCCLHLIRAFLRFEKRSQKSRRCISRTDNIEERRFKVISFLAHNTWHILRVFRHILNFKSIFINCINFRIKICVSRKSNIILTNYTCIRTIKKIIFSLYELTLSLLNKIFNNVMSREN